MGFTCRLNRKWVLGKRRRDVEGFSLSPLLLLGQSGVLTTLECGLSTRAGMRLFLMLGSPAFGPVCGDSGEGVCVGKLPDSNPEVFAQSQPSPLLRKHSQPHYSKTKGGGG